MAAPAIDDLEAKLGKIARVLTGEPRVERERFVLPTHAADHGDDEDVLLGYVDLLAARFRYSDTTRLDTAEAGVTGAHRAGRRGSTRAPSVGR